MLRKLSLHVCVINQRSPVPHSKPQRTTHHLNFMRRDSFTLQAKPFPLQAIRSLFTATYSPCAPMSLTTRPDPCTTVDPLQSAGTRFVVHDRGTSSDESKTRQKVVKLALGSRCPYHQNVTVTSLETYHLLESAGLSVRPCQLFPSIPLISTVDEVHKYSESQTSLCSPAPAATLTGARCDTLHTYDMTCLAQAIQRVPAGFSRERGPHQSSRID